mmetsp:Transcript_7176/g.12546  ORF Transcript_7176/g.12546 Transcript_7176/m.12546 type:complete len:188 (+) Transcript_7176:95-658(+)
MARNIGEGSFVCDSVELVGPYPITIGSSCAIGPNASIRAIGGPIKIGCNNVVEERVLIENPGREETVGQDEAVEMTIGDNNLFQVEAAVRCKTIGSANVFEVKSAIGPDSVVENGCVVGISVALGSDETLESGTVVFRADTLDPPVQRRKSPNLEVEHSLIASKYCSLLLDPANKCALVQEHKPKSF